MPATCPHCGAESTTVVDPLLPDRDHVAYECPEGCPIFRGPA